MKIIKSITCFFALAMLLSACNGFKGYTINGKVTSGITGGIKKVYLDQLGTTKTTTIDTSSIGTDGTFKMKGFVKDEGLYRLRFTNDKFIYLVVQNLPIAVTVNLDSLQNYTVSGSPTTSELKSFLDTLTARNKIMMELQKSLSQSGNKDTSTDKKQTQEVFQKIMLISSGTQAYVNKFVDTVKDPVVAIFAVNTLNFSENLTKFTTLANKLLQKYPDNAFVKDYAGLIKQMNQQIEANKASNFKIGDEVPDISLPGTDGKVISLSSLRGKYVLLDFWASWCQPCRAENPNIVKAYDKYKDKGFTIYSVSLDTKKDHWLTAISHDNLSWTNHVSELKGWDSKVVTQYHFDEIPHNLLLDTQGKVVAVDLRGDALENALASLIQ